METPTVAGPQVYLTFPKPFWPLPASLPPTVPAPIGEGTLRAPFTIPSALYNFILHPLVPASFALAYVGIVFLLNIYNAKREHKPWWISRQKPFRFFVVAHNVFLALYSLATFIAMVRAILQTLPWSENEHGAAGYADALCKIHGPRGLGDAVAYNTTLNIWETKNSLIKLTRDGVPDSTDVGRLWNEGLAFWGWIFYVSKFYEVVDTFIILAKGKRSAFLQTYHHAGAMLCMWAGIRYMSPPIWMFVFINSFIHALMYTYFALSAVDIRVPGTVKRTLTSMQIAQFLFGASYAAAHLFIKYDIPISTPYEVISTAQNVASSVSSAAVVATSTISDVFESPTVSASMGALLKKLLLRAAGEEGVAQRVGMHREDLISSATPELEKKMQHFFTEKFETKWHTDLTAVDCIDTSGEAFAIYLNLLYLAPLTMLFARFFVRAYMRRGPTQTVSGFARRASSSAADATKETRRSIENAGREAEDKVDKNVSKAMEGTKDIREELRRDVQALKEGTFESPKKQKGKKGGDKSASLSESAIEDGSEKPEAKSDDTPSGSPKKPSGSAKRDASKEKSSSDSTSTLPKAEQDANLAETKPTSPGTEEQNTADQPSSVKQEEIKEEDSEDTTESKEAQDTNLAESQDIRPGSSDETMGASGSLVDVSKEDAGPAGSDTTA